MATRLWLAGRGAGLQAGSRALALGAALAAFAAGPAAQPGAPLLERASASVVQVRATGCRGSDRSGTGFVWPDRNRVVTALHVVESCSRVSVYFERFGVQTSASIERTVAASDLSLLHVSDAPDSAVAVLAPDATDSYQDLFTLGYRLNVPKMASSRLTVPYGSRRLEDMLPNSVRRMLAETGVPSLDLEILPLEGHLLPGHSGAPIFDVKGHVVAMGDGGLDGGTVEIGWGVPASHIRKLAASSERVARLSAPSAAHFAMEAPSSGEDTIRCGVLGLTKVRTRSFKALVRASDDADGIQGLAELMGLGGVDLAAERFDVYQDERSGATVVVPAGLLVEETLDADSCSVEVAAPGRVEMSIVGRKVVGPRGAGAAVAQLHQDVYGASGLQWQRDPTFSYAEWRPRFDGLEVMRQSFTGYMPTPFGPQQQRLAFESLLSRRSTLVGVAVVSHEGEHLTPVNILQCALRQGDSYCRDVEAHARQFMLMIAATYLSTFALG